MSNILMQYDWNNHKEVNIEKLVNIFFKLTLSDKKAVYRILTDRRKKLLKSGYQRQKEAKFKNDFKYSKEYAFKHLQEYINLSDLKTELELELTIDILITDMKVRYFDRETSNLDKEYESFLKAKDKMIGWVGSMVIRKYPIEPTNETLEDTSEHKLMQQLEGLEYIPPTTVNTQLKIEKEKWYFCYELLGTPHSRIERIIIGLSKLYKVLTERGINDDIVNNAIEEFNIFKDSYYIDELGILYEILLEEYEESP